MGQYVYDMPSGDLEVGHTSLTRRNVGGSPTAGNHTAETRTGWLGREDSNLGIAGVAHISQRQHNSAADRNMLKITHTTAR